MFTWIKELRSTEKGKTIFKFSLYLLFFFFVIVLCLVGGAMKGPTASSNNSSYEESRPQEESHTVKTTLTYFEKQKILYEGKYTFEYEIVSDEIKVSFLGDYDAGQVNGFKEDENELIYYTIEDGIAYKVAFTDKTPIENIYAGLDRKLFDYKELFALLNGTSATISKEGNKKIYTYKIAERVYKVTSDLDNIEKIEISSSRENYVLKFRY